MDAPARQGLTRQGLKVYHDAGDKAITDIVAVPGLHCPPEASWTWTDNQYNWLQSDKALKRAIPESRIMLFQYNSAYRGDFAVDTCMVELGRSLLQPLQNMRQKRPMIFIGHSMGGLVIAQALALANSERSDFHFMYECFAGCLFFGTPFRGTPDLDPHRLLAYARKRHGPGSSFYRSLLDFMQPRNEGLTNLRHDLRRLETLLDPKVELHCFFETEKSGESDSVNVDKESAVLDGPKYTAIARLHRDLVRYQSENDEIYTGYVLVPLKIMVGRCTDSVPKRLHRSSTLYVLPEILKNIQEKLEGQSAAGLRGTLSKRTRQTRFVLVDEEYLAWKRSSENHSPPCLLIKGPAGRGKTGTVLAIIEDLEKRVKNADPTNRPLLAYYFCEGESADVEEMLKTILHQLISQEETLAVRAKPFVSSKSDPNPMQAPIIALSLENLWVTLQHVLLDLERQSRRVYIVISNMHRLDRAQVSTEKFYQMMRKDVLTLNGSPLTSHRWLWTSQSDDDFRRGVAQKAASSTSTEQTELCAGETLMLGVIDLNGEKYNGDIRRAISEHAHDLLCEFREQRRFKAALFQWSQAAISASAPDNKWVDLAYLQLKALPVNATDTHIRRTLEHCPCNLDTLMRNLWTRVLTTSADREDVKEVLRALVLTFQDPTLEELAILSGLEDKEDDLRRFLQACEPLVRVVESSATKEGQVMTRVEFATPEVKTHLKLGLEALLHLNADEQKRQNVLLAWRCYSSLQESLAKIRAEIEECAEKDRSKENLGDAVMAADVETHMSDDESCETDQAWQAHVDALRVAGKHYAVRHWLRHGKLAGEFFASTFVPELQSPASLQKFLADWLYFYTSESSEFDAILVDWLQYQEDVMKQKHRDNRNEVREYRESMPDDAEDYDTYIGPTEITDNDATITGLQPSTVDTSDSQEPKESEINGEDVPDQVSAITDEDDDDDDDDNVSYSERLLQGLKTIHIAAALGFTELVLAAATSTGNTAAEINACIYGYTPLHFAASNGDTACVSTLLDRGARVDIGDGNVGTPLHIAAHSGRVRVLELLLEHSEGTSEDASSYTRTFVGPVTNVAILSGNQKAMRLCFERKLHVKYIGDSTSPPLIQAAGSPDVEMFEAVLKTAAGEWVQGDFDQSLMVSSCFGRTANLTALLQFTSAEEPPRMFELGYYQEALRWATLNQVWDTIKTLLESCPDMGLDCSETFAAAILNMSKDEPVDTDHLLTKLWLRDRRHLNEKVIDDCLFIAADNYQTTFVKWLLEHCGANPGAKGKGWGNALTAAANDGMLDIINILLAHSANVSDAINSKDGFALQAAAKVGHRHVVESLVERGANINQIYDGPQDYFEDGTALQGACVRNQVGIAKYLIDHGADVNLGRGTFGRPLIAATSHGYKDLLQILLDCPRIAVNAPGGPTNTTALITAAATLPLESVDLLVQRGARLNMADSRGHTAAMEAAYTNNLPVLQFLCEQHREEMNLFDCDVGGLMAIDVALHAGNQQCVHYLYEKMRPSICGLKQGALERQAKHYSSTLGRRALQGIRHLKQLLPSTHGHLNHDVNELSEPVEHEKDVQHRVDILEDENRTLAAEVLRLRQGHDGATEEQQQSHLLQDENAKLLAELTDIRTAHQSALEQLNSQLTDLRQSYDSLLRDSQAQGEELAYRRSAMTPNY